MLTSYLDMKQSDENKQVVKKIKLYMEGQGLTQYEFAAKIGAPPQTVNRWLNEKTEISNAYLAVMKSNNIL